jgi:hypothetical protein
VYAKAEELSTMLLFKNRRKIKRGRRKENRGHQKRRVGGRRIKKKQKETKKLSVHTATQYISI